MSEPDVLSAITPAPVSVILPASNQASHLEGVVAAWTETLGSLGSGYEILLVDDGSTDQTGTRAEALAASLGSLRLLRHPRPRGFGAAIRTGLEAAQHPLVAYCPADLSYRPADLHELLKSINDVHLATGYRVTAAGRYRRSLRDRRDRWLARWVFAVHLSDPGCLFLLARRSLFARLPIQSDGLFAHVEILAKANFLGCLLTEVPVHYQTPAPAEAGLASASARPYLAEAYRLFAHPDFGPAPAPGEASPAS
jgi:glycosyltransferase involved in cell wall biosynthesis